MSIIQNFNQASLLFFFPILLFCTCSKSPNKEEKVEAVEPVIQDNIEAPDTVFVADTTYDYEFNIDTHTTDTFKLVSHSWYFFYCFEKFLTPQQLKKNLGNKFLVIKEISASQIEHLDKDTMYRVKSDGGFIKFFQTNVSDVSDETEMALVSAKIVDPSMLMTNGLRVGLTRDEVKNILFRKGEPKGIRNYSHLLIATALDGVWIDLDFDNDRLSKIIIDTDYQLNKD